FFGFLVTLGVDYLIELGYVSTRVKEIVRSALDIGHPPINLDSGLSPANLDKPAMRRHTQPRTADTAAFRAITVWDLLDVDSPVREAIQESRSCFSLLFPHFRIVQNADFKN